MSSTVQVDRKDSWRKLQCVAFPGRESEGARPMTDTVLDGEYVMGTDPATGTVSVFHGLVGRSGSTLSTPLRHLLQNKLTYLFSECLAYSCLTASF